MLLVCEFNGWLEIDSTKVRLLDCETDEVKTAQEWLDTRGNIQNLIIEDFGLVYNNATDGEDEQILRIEEY